MKKIRNILNLSLLGIGMLVLTNKKVSKCIDDAVLLENRNPGYYEYLSNSDIYYVSKEALNQPNDNLLTNVMQNTDFGDIGFKILVHEDGTCTFTGKYTGKDPFYLYPMDIGHLKSGDYILSDGGASVDNGIQMRIFGVKETPNGESEHEERVQLPGDGEFSWDETNYYCAKLDVIIYPGFSAENLRFYPMLCEESKGKIPYQNALRKVASLSDDQVENDYITYMEIRTTKESLNELKKKDWQILYNEAKYQKHVNWVTIDFGDGTGVQICDNDPNMMIYGEIDTVGRVRK